MKAIFSSLARCDLSDTSVRRDLPPDFLELSQPFETMYDRTTLWYDAIWTGRRVALVCPLLLNLEPILAGGQVYLDGRPVRPVRVEHRLSHSIVWFAARAQPRTVSVNVGGRQLSTPVSDQSDTAFFAGLNTAILLQKNNDLTWIRDFLIYHRVQHGLQAALIFDNGSESCTVDDLAVTCAEAGLEKALVLPAPYRFGPEAERASGELNWAGRSLQYSLLNIARLRFIRRARAVLQCDIDELVYCRDGRSVFDLTRWHPLGLVRFGLSWRHAQTDGYTLPRHRDHLWKRRTPDDCPPKYCINPRGALGWASMGVHGLAFRGFHRIPLSRKVAAWHFRSITTGWKKSRKKAVPPDELVHDSDIAARIANVDFDAFATPVELDVIRDDRVA